MQTLTLSSHPTKRQLLASKPLLQLRTFRFLSERYARRERPSVAAEYLLFAVIVLAATWPIFTLVHVLELMR